MHRFILLHVYMQAAVAARRHRALDQSKLTASLLAGEVNGHRYAQKNILPQVRFLSFHKFRLG